MALLEDCMAGMLPSVNGILCACGMHVLTVAAFAHAAPACLQHLCKYQHQGELPRPGPFSQNARLYIGDRVYCHGLQWVVMHSVACAYEQLWCTMHMHAGTC